MKRFYKISLCIAAGLAVGAAFANVKFPGYKHGMIMLMNGKGMQAKPLYFTGSGGRQVLMLSVKNHQRSRDIEFRMDGAEIRSSYPPVVTMPFSRKVSFEAGKFKGVEYGKSIPVFLAFNDDGMDRKLEIFDSTTGSLIQTVDLVRGESDERRDH